MTSHFRRRIRERRVREVSVPMPSPQQTRCRSRCGAEKAALAGGSQGFGRTWQWSSWNEARMERYLVQ